ncbi:class II fructose-bisphosphate aldolase [Pectinatus haikarae]|uniref:Fructose-bisphosphate aldolase class II n=1 Tax=Pectinatus haikarae TaxID=349096 RepID=A0ABT9YAW5_9FIRM|nr:class II fructose-bisphosphate aldolase [Pectinatus haikarae]MDQ0204864.1 fructose-bisphosphate aldolase class II [Pectinatus haikarae]
MLVNMREILEDAEKNHYAIGCINSPNEETIRGLIKAAEEMNTPLIIDHAQVHDQLIPIERIGPLMIKYAEKAKVPICVHLDHGSDFTFVMRAIRCGFPSIMYDCSAMSFEKNVEELAAFTKIAHKLNITVEAELGVMSSTEEDSHGGKPLTREDIKKSFTDPAQAAEFAERTGIDALAVCFGTMHGIYAEEPLLDIERVKEIRKQVNDKCRIVMHGGSGVDADQVQQAITAGCSKINYYSYMAKATSKHVWEKLNAAKGSMFYHEVQEDAYHFIKDYAQDIIKMFRNNK